MRQVMRSLLLKKNINRMFMYKKYTAQNVTEWTLKKGLILISMHKELLFVRYLRITI
jgi:hypothetical protein